MTGHLFDFQRITNVALILLILNIHLFASSKVSKKKPHIITLIADDWGWNTWGLHAKDNAAKNFEKELGENFVDLTGNQVMQIANNLFEAMDNYGTDWDSSTGITPSFEKIKTNNDFDNLVSAFGTRTLNCGTGNPFCTDFTGNLIECLRDELDEDEISEVNDILRRNSVSRTI
jgi:hypothetical protein